jgi:dipeptidyl aminopeptidase/acylaminoacyl peptidase
VKPSVLWSSADTTSELLSPDCPSEVIALVHETFSAPPEIEVGTIGHWRDLTNVNAGLATPLRAQSVSWTSDGYNVQGWLLLPDHTATKPAKLPMITLVHGGPAAAVLPRFVGPGLARTLCETSCAASTRPRKSPRSRRPDWASPATATAVS